MTFLNLALLLSCEPSEDLSEMLPQTPVEYLSTILRDEDDVITYTPILCAVAFCTSTIGSLS